MASEPCINGMSHLLTVGVAVGGGPSVALGPGILVFRPRFRDCVATFLFGNPPGGEFQTDCAIRPHPVDLAVADLFFLGSFRRCGGPRPVAIRNEPLILRPFRLLGSPETHRPATLLRSNREI